MSGVTRLAALASCALALGVAGGWSGEIVREVLDSYNFV